MPCTHLPRIPVLYPNHCEAIDRNVLFILYPRQQGPNLHDQILSYCKQAGFVPRIVRETSPVHTILAMVAANAGISLVPASLQQVQHRGVVYLPLEDPTLQVELAVAWQRADTSPLLHDFLNVVRRVSQEFRHSYSAPPSGSYLKDAR